MFIDDDSRLSHNFGRQYRPVPIVVGVDLSGREPFERRCIREMLRRVFSDQYVDPEAPSTRCDPLKIVALGDRSHYLEVVFIPPGSSDYRLDETHVAEIEAALMAGKEGSWA